MSDDRLFPGELPYKELQRRIRRWVQYIWKRCEAGGADQKGFGEHLGFKRSTINNLIHNRELPGFPMFSRLVFRFPQWSANELIHGEPPHLDTKGVPPLELDRTKVAGRKRATGASQAAS